MHLRFYYSSMVVFSIIVAAFLFCIAAVAQGPTWTDYNGLFGALAERQGVAVGSPAWVQGGNATYAGQTGGQDGCYGFNHAHKLRTDPERRATIANALARAMYVWSDKPIVFRSDYEGAGRPKLWKPVFPFDLPDGRRSWIVPASQLGVLAPLYPTAPADATARLVAVTGKEGMHWWPKRIAQLIQLGDAAGWTVPYGGAQFGLPETVRASDLARLALSLEAQSVIGALRDPYAAVHAGNERWVARLIDGALDCHIAGALLDRDATTLISWIYAGVLPEYNKAPGVTLFYGLRPSAVPPITVTDRPFTLTWQAAWAGAALHRIVMYAPQHAPAIAPVARRFLQWHVDTVSADGVAPTLISFDPAEVASWTAPPASLTPILASGHAMLHIEYDFTAWTYNAMRHAAAMGIAGAAEKAAAMLSRMPKTDENAKWAVDENGVCVWPEFR